MLFFLCLGQDGEEGSLLLAQALLTISLVILRCCVRLFIAVSFIYIYLKSFFVVVCLFVFFPLEDFLT